MSGVDKSINGTADNEPLITNHCLDNGFAR